MRERERLECLVGSRFDDEARLVAQTVSFQTGVIRMLASNGDDGVLAARFPGSRVIFAAGRFGPLTALDDANVARITGHEVGHEVQHRIFGSEIANA